MNINNSNITGDPSSFRDPSGFIFSRNGEIYRQVNHVYQEHYDLLSSSGLAKKLTERGLLIPHQEVEISHAADQNAYRVIKPEKIPFISYPYEWSFSQLKDAALLTLEIQKLALEHGLSLKDASAYNIQFHQGKPVFIDTLSFEKYRDGLPWVAYRQFCQHFLAPLALMSITDVRLNQLLRIHVDGVPLDLASKLLPLRTKFSFALLSHIHMHAQSQERYADKGSTVNKSTGGVNKMALLGILDSLTSAINGLTWKPGGTEWGDYYDKTNYTERSFEHKKELVLRFLEGKQQGTIWDLGGNTGVFSRIASQKAGMVISFDIDPAAVEQNYYQVRKNKEQTILPLVLDLTNPSPGIGWGNTERSSLLERGPADTILALALIHHLAISNNLPLPYIAKLFSKLSGSLIIEFVPKSDTYVQRLLASREDVFPNYTREGFEQAFAQYFTIEMSESVMESQRTLYLMTRK